MIRREIDLGDGRTCWLLVSQIEHARLSAVLAERCLGQFGQASCAPAAATQLESVRSELLQAIAHHDDGWRQWEIRPRLDSEPRRPLSFRELPLGESLENTNRSIQRAADLGPLSAWIVSGHFAALLESSERNHDPAQVAEWLAKTAEQRTAWLGKWQTLDPTVHTTELADEALVWLQAFDFLSLWICSVCPAGGERVSQWPSGYHINSNKLLDTHVIPDPLADDPEHVTVTVVPWRFDAPELSLEATAHIVPVREYQSTDELLAAYRPHELRWRLVPHLTEDV